MNPIYFISDLHLSSVNSPTTKSFFDFLENKISTPTSLYILGDLFEVWIGDDDDSELTAVIQAKLSDFASKGNKLFFIAGNRDFLLDKSFAASADIEILEDPCTPLTKWKLSSVMVIFCALMTQNIWTLENKSDLRLGRMTFLANP